MNIINVLVEVGKIVWEVKVASGTPCFAGCCEECYLPLQRIGLEAGPQWLFGALAEADLPVICVQTRHLRTVLKSQINKTDRYSFGLHFGVARQSANALLHLADDFPRPFHATCARSYAFPMSRGRPISNG